MTLDLWNHANIQGHCYEWRAPGSVEQHLNDKVRSMGAHVEHGACRDAGRIVATRSHGPIVIHEFARDDGEPENAIDLDNIASEDLWNNNDTVSAWDGKYCLQYEGSLIKEAKVDNYLRKALFKYHMRLETGSCKAHGWDNRTSNHCSSSNHVCRSTWTRGN